MTTNFEMRKLMNLLESVQEVEEVVEVDETETEEVQLDEDLGNLKQIDSDLLAPFQDLVRFGRKSSNLRAKFGRDSEVSVTPVKTATSIVKAMGDRNTGMEGAVIIVDGTQLVSFAVSERTYKGERYDIKLATQNTFVEVLGDDVGRTAYGKIHDKVYRTATEATIRSIISVIKKAAQATGSEVSGLMVAADKKRSNIRAGRLAAQRGAVAMMSPQEIRKQFRDELANKLAEFKASKATSVDDLEAAFEVFKEKTLDTIVIDGIAYEMTNDRLDWSSMQNPGNKWRESYLEFSASSASEDELYARKEAMVNELKGSGKTEQEWDAARLAIPPRSFKLMLKLDGYTIKPYALVRNNY